VIELDNVSYCYPGQTEPALRNVSLQLPPGQRIALIGRNGSGKSTLFLHCNGILQPSKGVVRFEGQPLAYNRRSLQELRRQVGIIFQNPDDQLFSANVAQDISFGPLNLGLNEAEVQRRVQEAAALCEISDILERPTHALSGGQKTRVALAGVLAMSPKMVLADELTSSLDPWMRRQVFAIFERLIEQSKSIVLAVHDIEIARRWANLVIIMEAGQVLACDTSAAIFADRALMKRTGLDELCF
jgi:cobalt/nickel transport system ATP-binding protein